MDQNAQPTADPGVVTSDVTDIPVTDTDASGGPETPPAPPPEPEFDASAFITKFDAAMRTKDAQNISASIQHVAVVLGPDAYEVVQLRGALRKLITG